MQIRSLGRIFAQRPTPLPADAAGLAWTPLSRIFCGKVFGQALSPHRKVQNWPFTAFGFHKRRLCAWMLIAHSQNHGEIISCTLPYAAEPSWWKYDCQRWRVNRLNDASVVSWQADEGGLGVFEQAIDCESTELRDQ